uniref:Chaperonin GroEL n=1 Tax=Neotessella volvocina TaxID=52559 RepID=A0A3G2QZU8_9STRA|nr:chaperonin GroEL [Neotessella volvocina]
MKKQFSLFQQLRRNLQAVEDIDQCIKITLGPTGKNGIKANEKGKLSFLTNGSLLIKSLEFSTSSANIILKLLQEACSKTSLIAGDGATTTILLSCQLLKSSLRLVESGYNSIFLSNGLKKIAYFLTEKLLEFSHPISKIENLIGILKTTLGKKVSKELFSLLQQCILQIGRDGMLLVEENVSSENEIEIVQGIELNKGFASSYFINDIKNYEVIYEKPYLLITNINIQSINQIRDIIEYIKVENKPLVIVAEEITKEIISTLVLNNIQKKIQIVVVKYKGIEFQKTGILEDLALLTHSQYFPEKFQKITRNFEISDLGQAEKVIIKKEKSTFIISKFSKVLAKRRINELNRELLSAESEYEKSLFKIRIARLSGRIAKIKLGLSNKYEIEEQRQKIEKAIHTIKSSLEEGFVPGGGIFYLYLKEELSNWSNLNLIGEEIFASFIVLEALSRPIKELFNNTNTIFYPISQKLEQLGYPYGFDFMEQKIVHTLNNGLIDSSKSVRTILWNSISMIATLITSE